MSGSIYLPAPDGSVATAPLIGYRPRRVPGCEPWRLGVQTRAVFAAWMIGAVVLGAFGWQACSKWRLNRRIHKERRDYLRYRLSSRDE